MTDDEIRDTLRILLRHPLSEQQRDEAIIRLWIFYKGRTGLRPVQVVAAILAGLDFERDLGGEGEPGRGTQKLSKGWTPDMRLGIALVAFGLVLAIGARGREVRSHKGGGREGDARSRGSDGDPQAHFDLQVHAALPDDQGHITHTDATAADANDEGDTVVRQRSDSSRVRLANHPQWHDSPTIDVPRGDALSRNFNPAGLDAGSGGSSKE